MAHASTSAGRILIIDDSKSGRQLVRLALEAACYEILELSSVREAPRVILRKTPDLVLMDVAMPGLSSDKAGEVIRATKALRRMKVVRFSEKSAEELDRLVQCCGADGYIKKPPDEADLVRRVGDWVTRARQTDPESS